MSESRICEQWCGRPEASDGCICLGKLRAILAEIERAPPSTPEEAARISTAVVQLRRILSGKFDPRTDWSRPDAAIPK